MELVDDSNSLLVVAKSTVFKLELDSCASFKSCEQCVQKSPHCGWCAGECTTAAQCSAKSSAISWLSLSSGKATTDDIESVCVEIASVQPSRKFKYDNEWIEIDFKRELSAVAPLNSTFECVFRGGQSSSSSIQLEQEVEGEEQELLRTDAVVVSSSKLKCALPHPSKIKFR